MNTENMWAQSAKESLPDFGDDLYAWERYVEQERDKCVAYEGRASLMVERLEDLEEGPRKESAQLLLALYHLVEPYLELENSLVQMIDEAGGVENWLKGSPHEISAESVVMADVSNARLVKSLKEDKDVGEYVAHMCNLVPYVTRTPDSSVDDYILGAHSRQLVDLFLRIGEEILGDQSDRGLDDTSVKRLREAISDFGEKD